jgi:hypothetical protein
MRPKNVSSSADTTNEDAEKRVATTFGGTPDPFDPNLYRVDQSYAQASVKKALIAVAVGKPRKDWFIRVHPFADYRGDYLVVELDRGETYLVTPDFALELGSLAVAKTLYTAITRQGTPFLWAVKLPGPDSNLDSWNESAREAASLAIEKWVSVRANQGDGRYDVFEALGTLSEPDWAALPPFRELLKIAFKGRLINESDHPVLRRLRGEA